VSLIEQAAKRLAELQRAGASVPGAASRAAPEVRARTAPPAEPAIVEVEKERPRVVVDLARLKALGFATDDARTSTLSQELRVLKRPILRAAAEEAAGAATARRVMITSALPGEGKTFTAINLALSIASEIDINVMLVDGDVAHPSMLDVLGVPSSAGLLDLLTRDELDIDDVLLDTNIAGLTLLPAGTLNAQATELIASDKMASLVAKLTVKFPSRIIVFDSAPLLVTTEARVLATHMGQVVMVVAADSTSRHSVQQALATLERCERVYTMPNKTVASDTVAYHSHYAAPPAG